MMWCTSLKKTTNRQRKMTNNLCEVLDVKHGLFTSEVPKNQTTWPQLKSCCSDTDPKPEIFDYCIVTWSWMKYFHKTMLVTEVRETCSRFTVALGSTLLIRQWLFCEWCFYQVVVGPWLVTQTSPLPQWTSTHSAASHDEDMMKTDVVPVPHVLSDETLTKNKQPRHKGTMTCFVCLFPWCFLLAAMACSSCDVSLSVLMSSGHMAVVSFLWRGLCFCFVFVCGLWARRVEKI